MPPFPTLLATLLSAWAGLFLYEPPPLLAESALLQSVKQNPALAKTLCKQFQALNTQGKSATTKESFQQVATSQGVNLADGEVVTIYVIGLYCPDVH